MIVTDDEDLYEPLLRDPRPGPRAQPTRVEVRARARSSGMNFRMTELSGAVLLAQVRKLDLIRDRLRANKAIVKSMIGEVPEIGFRTLTDPDGDLATHLVVMLPTAEIARNVADEVGSKVLAESGWQSTATWTTSSSGGPRPARAVPSTAPARTIRARSTGLGMLPKSDAILGRSISFGIGVKDPNLAPYGLTIGDGPDVAPRPAP